MCRRSSFRYRSGLAVALYLWAAATLAIGSVAPAGADELDALHNQILQHPGNSEFNLRFARLAETSGNLRWALAGYERVALNDPNNPDAQQGLQRVRRALQPDVTLVTLQAGAQYETNPRYYLPPRRAEMQGIGSATLLHERAINGTRWRTNALAAGLFHQHEGDLNYAVAGLDTGPVLDAMPGWTMRPAVGGSAAYFNRRFYYGEGALSTTFDSTLHGVYRSLQLRGAYRSYDSFFPSREGFYVEARGKLAVPNVLGAGSVAILSPWVVWSDIAGAVSVVTPVATELQPGAYLEWGGRFDLIRSATNWLVLGANVSISQRDYRNDIVLTSGAKRRDIILSPGAAVTFPNLFAHQSDLRFDYKYIWDNSNDPTKSFNDHIVGASIVTRFDPTLTERRPQ